MKHLFFILPFFVLLASCQSSSSGESSGVTSISADRNSIVVEASFDESERESIEVTFKNVPAAGLFVGVGVEKENYSISDADFNQNSDSSGLLSIDFVEAGSMAEGSHSNQVALAVCYDGDCNKHVSGSPFIVDTTLKVEKIETEVTITTNTISVTGNSAENKTPEREALSIKISGYDVTDLHVGAKEVSDENNAVSISTETRSGFIDLSFSFTEARFIHTEENTANYEIHVCFDYGCDRPIEGSPFKFDVIYTVSRFPEGSTLIDPSNRTQINHDVVDAEYSSQLDAIVIASSSPKNAVYVYDLNNVSNVNEIALNLIPTSVSFANAGKSNKIVVGHDAKVTHIDYNASNPTSSVIKILDIPVDVSDLVATDEAVFAVPRADQWEELHRINISDNALSKSDGNLINAGSKLKLHPDLKGVYLADRGISPSDIEKIDIQPSIPKYLYDSPYHGDYAMCGDLWLSNDGRRIYTKCGNTFNTSEVKDKDMIYSGKLPLLSSSTSYFDRYTLASVSESNSKNEIAVIEQQSEFACDDSPKQGCFYALSFFAKDFLSRISANMFDTVSVSGNEYFEKPEFVFYNKTGDKAFVVTNLLGIPTQRSYLVEFKR